MRDFPNVVETLALLFSAMNLRRLLFPPRPRLEWRIWTLLTAFVGGQFAFLVVSIAVEDALGGVLLSLSFLVGLLCVIWRRVLLVATNLGVQILVFLLLTVCAATGTGSMKAWHRVDRYKLLLVLHFSLYAIGIAVSAILLYLSTSRPRGLAADRKEAQASPLEPRTHGAHPNASSRHTTSQSLNLIRGFLNSKQPSSVRATLSSAEAKPASEAPCESISTDSGGEASAASDLNTTPRKREAYADQSLEGEHHFFAQEQHRGHADAYFYHATFSDFLSSPSLSLPSTMPAAAPVICAGSHLHGRVMPCSLQQSSGSAHGFLPISEEERSLQRPSSESVVVFNATDEKGLVLLHTTSASPAPSPKNASSITTSFGLASSLPTHRDPVADDLYMIDPQCITDDQAHLVRAAPKRCRIGAYSVEDYTYNCQAPMEDALPTFVVQLTGVHQRTDNVAQVEPLPVETIPAVQDASELLEKSMLPIGTWKMFKKRCRTSMRSALLYLGSSGEDALDKKTLRPREVPLRTISSYTNRDAMSQKGRHMRATIGRKRTPRKQYKTRRVSGPGTELDDLSARKHLGDKLGLEVALPLHEVPRSSWGSNGCKRERSKEFLVCWAGEVASNSGLSVPEDALLQAAVGGPRIESVLTTSSSEEEGSREEDKALNKEEAKPTGETKQFDKGGLLSFLGSLPVQARTDRRSESTASDATQPVVNLTASHLFINPNQDKGQTEDEDTNMPDTFDPRTGGVSEAEEGRSDCDSYRRCPAHLASSEMSSDIFPELEASEGNRSRSQDSSANTEKSSSRYAGLSKPITGGETNSLCDSDGTFRLSSESSQEHLFGYGFPFSSDGTKRGVVQHAQAQQREESGSSVGEQSAAPRRNNGPQNSKEWAARSTRLLRDDADFSGWSSEVGSEAEESCAKGALPPVSVLSRQSRRTSSGAGSW